MALTSLRMCTDGRRRYERGVDGGTVYFYRYDVLTSSIIPFRDGSARKSVMNATSADIDIFQSYIVVDNPDVGTYVTVDFGETWRSV